MPSERFSREISKHLKRGSMKMPISKDANAGIVAARRNTASALKEMFPVLKSASAKTAKTMDLAPLIMMSQRKNWLLLAPQVAVRFQN